ncbi:MAG: Dabb family protein [Pedosphaera sp.]|nr:Dabb family protein [Pedosphaera sp.]
MKYIVIVTGVLFLLTLGVTAAEVIAKRGRLVHSVFFKFKETATKEQIATVEKDFRALKAKIPGIITLESGMNVSPEKHDKGFTHAFILTFATDKDRDVYLVHPAHKAFGDSLGAVLADAFVIDFWAKE